MRDIWTRFRSVVIPVSLALALAVGLLFTSAAPEDRVDTLAAQLRCPTCQGESVAQSRSETAAAITQRITELVDEGRTDEEIREYFVARYGDWILLDPAFDARNLVLWLLPPLGLLLALISLRSWRRRGVAETPLTVDERERLEAVLTEWRRREHDDE